MKKSRAFVLLLRGTECYPHGLETELELEAELVPEPDWKSESESKLSPGPLNKDWQAALQAEKELTETPQQVKRPRETDFTGGTGTALDDVRTAKSARTTTNIPKSFIFGRVQTFQAIKGASQYFNTRELESQRH